MLVESHKKLTGNARFEGFAIDLATELSLLLGFNFTFKLVDDGKVRLLCMDELGSSELKTKGFFFSKTFRAEKKSAFTFLFCILDCVSII